MSTDSPEQFIGEELKPVAGTGTTAGMARGEPGLPQRFTWRGQEYEVRGVLQQWKSSGPCRNGASEVYLRRHWFRILTQPAAAMTVYFERQAKHPGRPKARWWIYSIMETIAAPAAPDGGAIAAHSAYASFADEYAEWVRVALNDPMSVLSLARTSLLDLVGNIRELQVCDLGCGEGHLSRELAARQGHVVAVDLCQPLLEIARRRSSEADVQWILDDAQVLRTIADAQFHIVVSNLALMDIPDLKSTYQAARRVLRPGGRFVFSITHPCFQSPGTTIDTSQAGGPVARRIVCYAREGPWHSEGGGIRSRIGACHRTLSTYVNTLVEAGFSITRIVEPVLPAGSYQDPFAQAMAELPAVLVVAAQVLGIRTAPAAIRRRTRR